MKKTPQSRNLKLLLLLVPLLGAMAISGCTSGGSTVSFGNGVTILNWEPSLSSVESGDKVQLRLKLQNTGAVAAENILAVPFGIDTGEWQFVEKSVKFSQLLPPKPSQNTDGETAQAYFSITSPSLPQGVTQQYSPSIRVYYSYSTTAIKPITIVNENELVRLQDQGKTLPSGDTTSTAGPLKVTINTGKFLKAKQGAMGGVINTFPITIVIENTGGGVVSPTPSNSLSPVAEADYTVDLAIKIPKNYLEIDNCGTFQYSSGVLKSVKLWKGQETSITCEAKVSPPLASVTENIEVSMVYEYYIDRTTTITVIGNR